MSPTPSIAVIGSLNIDFITRTPRVPEAGETLTSNSFSTGFGGKGANQAVACARLASEGTKVAMVGHVGDDNFGRDYFEALSKEGINADGVTTVKGETTGAANIVVEEETGENRIMFTPGANVAFGKEYDAGWDLVPSDAGVVVCQLEIPIEVVCLFPSIFGALWQDRLSYLCLWYLALTLITRSCTICTSPANKENTPCLTRHLHSHFPNLHTKTSTL
jgi:hypothetical protein